MQLRFSGIHQHVPGCTCPAAQRYQPFVFTFPYGSSCMPEIQEGPEAESANLIKEVAHAESQYGTFLSRFN